MVILAANILYSTFSHSVRGRSNVYFSNYKYEKKNYFPFEK